ncbi:MAG: two-partner secretion domain-containing protein, partial [Planctomycetota bacterium]
MSFGTSLSVALAGPEDAQVVHGQVSFQQSGNNTMITASDKSIINYSRFDIARPEIVEFIQPSSAASVLNRILSANPTSINGTLLANGRVFFVNPAGVIIGSEARINVNQLVASGLNISNDNFINGQYEFVGGDGAVANYGDISAQSVYLVGKQVTNIGNINCPAGYVVMAAGDRVFLGQPGSNVIVEIGSLEPPAQSDAQTPAEITNEGTVQAAGGRIILAAAGDALSRPIMKNIGSLSTSTAEGNAGDITLQANQGQISNTGSITAISESGAGGTVEADAGEVVNAGTVDASGAQGGTIAIQGTSRVGQFGTVNADGVTGDGGSIDLWAGDVVRNGARIEAKGGSESGDGGFVEISGKEHVEVQGQIDLTAIKGESGMLLIDPLDLWIVDSDTANGDVAESPTGTWKPIDEASVSELDIDTLEGYLSIADVTLSTLDTPDAEGQNGDVIFGAGRPLTSGVDEFDDPADNSLIVEAARHIEFTTGDGIAFQGDGDVKLYAGGHITSLNRDRGAISTLRGDIIMEAGSDGSGVGIDVSRLTIGAPGLDYPGEISLTTTNGGNITAGPLEVKGNGYGSIYVFSSGDLTINGSSPAVFIKTNVVPTPGDAFSFACLIAEEDVTINGDVTVEAHGKRESVAGIWIGAGTNVEDPVGGYPGTVTVNGNILADASVTGSEFVKSDATIRIYGSTINFNGNKKPEAKAKGGSVKYQDIITGYDDSDAVYEEEVPGSPDPIYDKLISGARALVDIDITKDGTCLNCGNVILPIALPDWLMESKNIGVYAIAVLANDEDGEGGPLIGGTVDPATLDPTSLLGGALTLNPNGTVTYDPPTDWVFDENGQFTDYFEYHCVDADGDISADPALVTITLVNQLPVADGGWATTPKADQVSISEATSISNPLVTFTLGSDADSEDSVW